jgi:hypothetical protein
MDEGLGIKMPTADYYLLDIKQCVFDDESNKFDLVRYYNSFMQDALFTVDE